MKYTARAHFGKIKHVYLNGVEVTQDCFEFDPDEGYVKVYKRNENGKKYRVGKNSMEAAYEVKYGVVEWNMGTWMDRDRLL